MCSISHMRERLFHILFNFHWNDTWLMSFHHKQNQLWLKDNRVIFTKIIFAHFKFSPLSVWFFSSSSIIVTLSQYYYSQLLHTSFHLWGEIDNNYHQSISSSNLSNDVTYVFFTHRFVSNSNKHEWKPSNGSVIRRKFWKMDAVNVIRAPSLKRGKADERLSDRVSIKVNSVLEMRFL